LFSLKNLGVVITFGYMFLQFSWCKKVAMKYKNILYWMRYNKEKHIIICWKMLNSVPGTLVKVTKSIIIILEHVRCVYSLNNVVFNVNFTFFSSLTSAPGVLVSMTHIFLARNYPSQLVNNLKFDSTIDSWIWFMNQMNW
jgi:hypothetical protein